MTKNRGFTIIEVVVAISIFSIGVLAIATIQIFSVKQIISSGKNSTCTFALVSEVNILSLKDYSADDLSFGNHKKTINNNVIEWEVTGITTRLKSIVVKYMDSNREIVQKITIYKAK